MDFDYDLFVIGGGSGGVRAARTIKCSRLLQMRSTNWASATAR